MLKKRKAQNRASQRAFRERKQSYVSSLEEKIEEYEKREAGLSMELQKMARRLKEENEELKRDNQKLKESLHKMKTEQMKQHNQQKNEPVFMPRNETLPLSTTSGMWNHWSDQSWNDSNKKESKSNSNSVAMNRDCGFCTEQSPCVCSGEGVLDLTQDESHLSTKMAPLKEGIDDHDKEMESPRKLPLARPLSTSLLAPQRIASKGKKLWYTIPNAFPVTICPTETKSSLASHNTKLLLPPPLQSLTRPKSKLWPVYSPLPNSALHQEGQSVPIYRLQKTMNGGNGSNGSGIEAACSGDPANCNACSTDPALAAFCRVVASHLSSDVNQQGKVKLALLDAGNALPLRNHRKRNHDGVQLLSSSFPTSPINNKNQSIGLNLYTNKTVDDNMQNQKVDSTDIKQTIPEAWQRIKQHPSFPSWQGGLNLLADVVSKRVDQMSSSSSSSSPLEEPPIPRVGIEKHSSVAMKFHLRSNDRKLDKEGFDKGQETSSKRRKLYVDNKSVEDALALLDRGFIKTKEKYCVCPLNRDL